MDIKPFVPPLVIFEEMYPGMAYSPITELTEPVSAVGNTIEILNGSALPDGPNLAVIGSSDNWETIRYQQKVGNQLQNVSRGIQEKGVGKAWGIGALISRRITEKDFANLIHNIWYLVDRIADIWSYFSSFGDYTLTSFNNLGIQIASVDNKIDSHSSLNNNPHEVNKSQVGLGDVENYPIASQIEAQNVSINDRYMTPKRTRNLLNFFMVDNLNSQYTDFILSANQGRVLNSIIVGTYNGENLETKYAAEISGHTSVWAWIKNRIQTGNFTGINIGDYIPLTLTDGKQFYMEVAGINTYKGLYGIGSTNHIDFISRDLYPEAISFNLSNVNNGIVGVKSGMVWLSSNLYAKLNSLAMNVPNNNVFPITTTAVDYTTTGVYDKLPAGLGDMLQNKYLDLPMRSSSSQLMNIDNNSTIFENIGKLWIPSEVEVKGRSTTSTFTSKNNIQYEIFKKGGTFKRQKGESHLSATTSMWWTATPMDNTTQMILVLTQQGITDGWHANPTNQNSFVRSPLCFRIS